MATQKPAALCGLQPAAHLHGRLGWPQQQRLEQHASTPHLQTAGADRLYSAAACCRYVGECIPMRGGVFLGGGWHCMGGVMQCQHGDHVLQ